MTKIGLIEHANVMKIRLSKLLAAYGYENLETVDPHKMTPDQVVQKLKGIQVVVIDSGDQLDETMDLISAFKEDANMGQVPLICLIPDLKPDQVKLLIAKGCRDLVLKPFTDIKFLETVFKHTDKPDFKQTLKQDLSANESLDASKIPSWNDDYVIGVEDIDSEHKTIIDHYEKLYLLMKEGQGHEYYKDLLSFLKDYIHQHLKNEEQLQQSIAYPHMKDHFTKHREFADHVAAIETMYQEGKVDNLSLIKINLFMKNWLIHHILIEDKKLAAFINKTD